MRLIMSIDNRLIGAFLAILVLCIHVDGDDRTNYDYGKPAVFPRPRNDPRFRRYDRPIPTSTGLAICGKYMCTEVSYEHIESRFGPIFQTDYQADHNTVQSCNHNGGTLSYGGSHGGGTSHSHDDGDRNERESGSRVTCDDGDACCPTSTSSRVLSRVENIHGERRFVIHLTGLTPPKYQYIHHGLCSSGENCDGPCFQEQRVQSVLVYNLSSRWFPITFDMVFVPSYCSCKNIGGTK